MTVAESLRDKSGGNFYFVKLYANLETRLARNAPHRLEDKALQAQYKVESE